MSANFFGLDRQIGPPIDFKPVAITPKMIDAAIKRSLEFEPRVFLVSPAEFKRQLDAGIIDKAGRFLTGRSSPSER